MTKNVDSRKPRPTSMIRTPNAIMRHRVEADTTGNGTTIELRIEGKTCLKGTRHPNTKDSVWHLTGFYDLGESRNSVNFHINMSIVAPENVMDIIVPHLERPLGQTDDVNHFSFRPDEFTLTCRTLASALISATTVPAPVRLLDVLSDLIVD